MLFMWLQENSALCQAGGAAPLGTCCAVSGPGCGLCHLHCVELPGETLLLTQSKGSLGDGSGWSRGVGDLGVTWALQGGII